MIYFEDTYPCEVCGEQFRKRDLETIFTGRSHYICFSCYQNGLRKVDENMSKKYAAKIKAIQEGRK